MMTRSFAVSLSVIDGPIEKQRAPHWTLLSHLSSPLSSVFPQTRDWYSVDWIVCRSLGETKIT